MITLQRIRGRWFFVVAGCAAFKTYPRAARELKEIESMIDLVDQL